MATKKTETVNERDYSASIQFSSFEMSAYDRVKFKDLSDAVRVDEETKAGPFTANIVNYVILSVHNGKSKSNPDYVNYVYITDEGKKICSGSESLWNAFSDIWDELKVDGSITSIPLKFYRVPSKNYSGKDFLTCSLA